MDRSVVMATVKLFGDFNLYIWKKELLLVSYRFKVVCNSHFYNYSMDRSVVMETIKLGVMSLPCILGRKSYCW